MTLNKLLGFSIENKNQGNPIDLTTIEIIMFDEVYLHNRKARTRIYDLINKHPNIIYVATGYNYQLSSIEEDSKIKCDARTDIQYLFPHTLKLTVNKRLYVNEVKIENFLLQQKKSSLDRLKNSFIKKRYEAYINDELTPANFRKQVLQQLETQVLLKNKEEDAWKVVKKMLFEDKVKRSPIYAMNYLVRNGFGKTTTEVETTTNLAHVNSTVREVNKIVMKKHLKRSTMEIGDSLTLIGYIKGMKLNKY